MREETKEVSKKLKDYTQTKPVELTMFEMLSLEDKKYSHTIELYDFMPKYFWGHYEREKVEKFKKEVLPDLERQFECRGKKYKIVIRPANIKGEDGIEKDYYPGEREELVEDALRKLVCEGKGVFLDDQAGIIFILNDLYIELKDQGHTYSRNQIKDALFVCNKAHITVKTEDGQSIFGSALFESVGFRTRGNKEEDEEQTKCFVKFNSLITNSIKEKTFRQIDYKRTMEYRSVVARQLHKRMSHHFTQASLATQYEIMLTTIIRDFGLTQYEKISHNLRDVRKALWEMVEKDVLLPANDKRLNPKASPVKEGIVFDTIRKNKIIDIKFTMIPHPRFCGEIKSANTLHRQMKIFTTE